MKKTFRMNVVSPCIALALIMAIFTPYIYSGDNIPQEIDYTQLLSEASWIVDHVLTGEYKVSRLEEAISMFNKVLENNKDEADAYLGLGEAYYLQAQEDNKISKRYWDKAVQLNPGIKEEIKTIKTFNTELTVLEEQLKNVDEEGRQEQEQSLKDAKYVIALVELTEEFSEILSREDPLNQNFSPIIEHGLELIKSNPDEPVSYFIVGNLYYLNGDEIKADEYWDNAIKLDSKFAYQINRQKNLLNMVVRTDRSKDQDKSLDTEEQEGAGEAGRDKLDDDPSNKAARDKAVGKVQSAIAIYFAVSLADGVAKWPAQITEDLFDDEEMPKSNFGGYTWSYDFSTHRVLTN